MYKAHDFNLADQQGQMHSLQDYKGKWVILYFYPKDDTPGCTLEACSFRDLSTELETKGVAIIGVSKDSIASHAKFHSHHSLNFTILSDPQAKLISAYGSSKEKSMFGKKYIGVSRDTFVIDPSGNVVCEYRGVNPLSHVKEINNDLKDLMKATIVS